MINYWLIDNVKRELSTIKSARLHSINGIAVLTYKRKGWHGIYFSADNNRYVVSGYSSRQETIKIIADSIHHNFNMWSYITYSELKSSLYFANFDNYRMGLRYSF